MVLDTLYDVPCKIQHIQCGKELLNHIETIAEYFDKFGGLIMMGGDQDAASKGIAGVHISDSGTYLLIIVSFFFKLFSKAIYLLIAIQSKQDPHFVGSSPSAQHLMSIGFVSWQNIKSFSQHSFYNLCLPQIRLRNSK